MYSVKNLMKFGDIQCKLRKSKITGVGNVNGGKISLLRSWCCSFTDQNDKSSEYFKV